MFVYLFAVVAVVVFSYIARHFLRQSLPKVFYFRFNSIILIITPHATFMYECVRKLYILGNIYKGKDTQNCLV